LNSIQLMKALMEKVIQDVSLDNLIAKCYIMRDGYHLKSQEHILLEDFVDFIGEQWYERHKR
jgi:hypothetical protein